MRSEEHRIQQAARGAVHYVLQLCESGACVVYPTHKVIQYALLRYAKYSGLSDAAQRAAWNALVREAYAAVAHRIIKVERHIQQTMRALDHHEEPCANRFEERMRRRVVAELAEELDAAEIRMRILDDIRHTIGPMLQQEITTSKQRQRKRYRTHRPIAR